MKNKFTYLKPDYYNDFACIGPECRANCCSHPWNIDIDKTTYKKYSNTKLIKDKALLADFRKYVKKNKDSTSSQDYARINFLTEPFKCGFQSEDGLCKIHKSLGEGYLSNTCKIYPRGYSLTAPYVMEHALSSSCEALVKILLDKKTPIMFNTEEEELSLNQFKHKFPLYLNQMNEQESMKPYYLDIKTVCIAILQDRKYDIEERLCILVFFLNKIHNLDIKKKYDECEPFINAFIDMMSKEDFDYFNNIKLDMEKQFSISYIFTKYYFSASYESKNVYFMKDIEKAYGLIELHKLENGLIKFSEKDIANYKKYSDKYYKFLEDRKEFIENILVNEFHTKCMPFFAGFNIFENATLLAVYYSVMRIFMSAYLHDKDEITDQEIIDIYAFYGKVCLHTKESFRKAISFLNSNDSLEGGGIFNLIKRSS